MSLLDRLDERLGGRMVVGGGWWVKLGGWCEDDSMLAASFIFQLQI